VSKLVDTEKLREQLEVVETHLLATYELLQTLISTNSIYPIYMKEGKSSRKELREAINALTEMKKDLGLPSDETEISTSETETSASSENEPANTLEAQVTPDVETLREHLSDVDASVLTAMENIHIINTANAIYPIHINDGIECETELAATMNALLGLKSALEQYAVAERVKAEEQLPHKEIQCDSSVRLQVQWRCPLCQAELTTTLAINIAEAEPELVAKPHYSNPAEAQECQAALFYVSYRHPELKVVASIPEES